jgi:hypothetical protein
MTICEQIGDWAAGLTEAEIPGDVRIRAELQRRSIEAAAAAGASAAASFVHVAPDGLLGEIYASAAASMAHDWDDYLYMGHTGHSAVPTARAFSDDPARALLAQVAANEVAGRLGLALFVGPHNGQFWASIHCAGAAVAAGVAMGLDADQLAHALSIALYQPPYGLWPGFMGPASKLLTAADPAIQGARAALLAADGVRGALDIIEDDRGLLTHLAFIRREGAFGGLGDVWLTDTIAFKPRPGCAYLQAAVDAALRSGIALRDVREVDISAGYLTVAMESLGSRAGFGPVGVTFSARLSVAVALLAGRLTHAELDPGWLGEHASSLRELAGRTRLRHDWELTLATVEGAAAGGASLGDVPLRAWGRAIRRLRDLRMTELALNASELGGLARNPRLLRRLRRAAVGSGAAGTAALDTSALRMTFPCRLTLRLRSGRTIEVAGGEPGACGHPVAEQSEVVARKCDTVGVPAALA